MHEFLHGMGFQSSATYNSLFGLYELGWSGSPNIFDLCLRDGDGNMVWGNPDYESSTQLKALFTSDDVWFELESGEMVKLYAPDPWSGQAVSHLDEMYEQTTNQIMTPFYNINTIHLDVGWIVKRVHETNGWTLNTMTPPIADFSVNDTTPDVGEVVNFTDVSSNDPVEWSWNFGDDNTSTDQNPTHSYSTPGTYTVTLTVANYDGESEVVKVDYITASTVLNPTAGFSGTPTSGYAPLVVQFSDNSNQGTYPITSWSWDFGDGVGTSTEEAPQYTYDSPGTYTVTLTVSDGTLSDTETKTDYISVYDELIVDAGSDQSISAGTSTTLEGTFSGGSGNIEIVWEPQSLIVTQGILNPQTVELQQDTKFYLSITDVVTEIIKMDSMQIGITVGIESFEKNGILIYPNPANEKVNIEFTEAKVRQLKVTDISGRILLTKTLVNKSEMVDLSSLENGVYIISVQEGDKLRTSRIIKE
jgi:PKD repeat protein